MTDNNGEITIIDDTLDAEELARAEREQVARIERDMRVSRQNETLEELSAIIDDSKTGTLTHYGIVQDTVVNGDALVIIGSTNKVLVISVYERDMYTDELQRVAEKRAEAHNHKLSDWNYTYSPRINFATCIYCGEPVIQQEREMPKGQSVLASYCSKNH